MQEERKKNEKKIERGTRRIVKKIPPYNIEIKKNNKRYKKY